MNGIDSIKLQGLVVAIVDDHEVVLEGFRSFMLSSGVGQVEAFKTAHELLNRMAAVRFDVVIVDVELPDMDAAQLIDSMRSCQADVRIVVHTIHEEMWVVNRMVKKHVDGVVYKTARLEKLLEAIVAVTEGRQYFCPKFRKLLNIIEINGCVLSERELEVLHEIARGKSTKEISKTLFLSAYTVENHRRNLLRKLNARNVADLVVRAITAGYLNPAEL